MTKETFFEIIGELDGDKVAAADAPARRRRPAWLRREAIAACLVLVIALGGLAVGRFWPLAQLQPGGVDDPQLAPLVLSDASYNVTARYASPKSQTSTSAELVWLTEEELFTTFDTAVFKGYVAGLIGSVELDFNGQKEYRAIAEITVEEVYRGDIASGDMIKLLLPCPVGVAGLWVEDTGVVSQISRSAGGIFMPVLYTENSCLEMNGGHLRLLDIADGCFPDGERFAFLDTTDGLVFERGAYPTIADVGTLDDIEAYVIEMIEKTSVQ